MKCLSLWQPWATLMAIGAKPIETRGWYTSHRGPIAIHAAKRWTRELREQCLEPPFFDVLFRQGYVIGTGLGGHEIDLPLGAIVCVCDLVDCYRFREEDTFDDGFGDYTPGRFGWRVANVRKLATPITYRGAQGLFDVDDAIVEAPSHRPEAGATVAGAGGGA